MSEIEITNFPSISQDELNNLGDTLARWVLDNYPEIDISRGSAFYNIVIKPAALLYALIANQSELTKQATTLLGNTDEDQIEAILANIFIDRDQGIKAKGILNVVLKSDIDTVVGTGNIFSSNSLDYYPVQEYSYTSGTGSTMTIEVEADFSGIAYNVSEDTLFTSDNLNVNSATSPNDISNGQDEEDIDDVIERARTSFATRGFYNKRSIDATLKEEFSNIYYLYVAGFGDELMTRDVGSFGVHSGSMMDIYARTIKGPSIKTVTETVASSIITLDDADYPPILDIISITINGVEVKNYTISRTIKDTVHSIDNARFTSFENIVITFSTTEYDTKSASINYHSMSDIKTVQEYADSDSVKNLLADVLIKSVVPYYVDINCEYSLNDGITITESEVRTIVVNAINTMNDGLLNGNYINSVLYSSGIIVKKILISTISYSDSLLPVIDILNTTYKDYKNTRISFFSNIIKVTQVW